MNNIEYFKSILYRSCWCLAVQGPTNGRRHWASYTGNIIYNKLISLSVRTKRRSRGSSVSMVIGLRAERPKNLRLNSRRGQIFFSSSQLPGRFFGGTENGKFILVFITYRTSLSNSLLGSNLFFALYHFFS